MSETKFQLSTTFSQEVTFPRPGKPKPGEEPLVIEFDFVWKTKSEFIAYCKDGAELRDAEFLAGLISGWQRETLFSQEALGRLLDTYPRASDRIFDAYQDALQGVDEKN